MAPKFPLFTKGSKLPLNKGFKNMFELLQSCAKPSICNTYASSFGENKLKGGVRSVISDVNCWPVLSRNLYVYFC